MKITVITATFNSALTIEDTINSLISQDYPDIEYIIVDGASTDNTLDIVRSYGERIDVVVSEKDDGIYDAFNKGIARATGEIVGFLNSDDFFTDSRVLSRIADAFSIQSTDAVYGDLNYVSKFDTTKIVRRWVSGSFKRSSFKYGWMPPHPTFYMRRKHYLLLGSFNLKFSISADYDSMLRYLWANNLNATYIPSVLITMRVGGKSNQNLINILKKTNEDMDIMVENGIPPVRGVLLKNLFKIKQFF